MDNQHILSRSIGYSNFYLIIESEGTYIYSDKERTHHIGDISDYNYSILKAISIDDTDGHITVLLQSGSMLIGWVELQDSLLLYRKQHEQVEIDLTQYKTSELSLLIDDKKDYQLAFNAYNLSSRFYCFYKGERMEVIYKGKNMLAIVESKYVAHQVALEVEDVTIEQTIVYSSSKFNEALDQHYFDFNRPFTIIAAYPELGRLKVKQGERTGWISNSAASYSVQIDEKSDETIYSEHMNYCYIHETELTQSVVKRLLNENISLRNKLIKASEQRDRIETLYQNLKKSKLGSIQVKIWERRKKGGKKR
ncbi:hypothetical protein [Macrococcoides canis]|uniref:hypothetical protein n=1 Tax=Macrococcoides canis TaxID=1855823 RepID=UPI0010FBFED0|nr:hypothetical protein [Macrococcus canis]QCT74490.1 hypothetical protein EST43_04205 [Macrococcus canis]